MCNNLLTWNHVLKGNKQSQVNKSVEIKSIALIDNNIKVINTDGDEYYLKFDSKKITSASENTSRSEF
jgi:hypothetical protein